MVKLAPMLLIVKIVTRLNKNVVLKQSVVDPRN